MTAVFAVDRGTRGRVGHPDTIQISVGNFIINVAERAVFFAFLGIFRSTHFYDCMFDCIMIDNPVENCFFF